MPENILRIVTYNVHFAENTDRIIRAFKEHENLRAADIIFLQEVEHHEIETISRAQKIAEALGFHHSYSPSRPLRPAKTKGTHGLAILSRYELTDLATISLPKHTFLGRTDPRIALTAFVNIKGARIHLANIHLDTRLNSPERIAQVKTLVDEIKKDPARRVILGGDFNMLPFHFYKSLPVFYRNQKKAIHAYLKKEGFSCHCETGGHTIQSAIFRFELDGIYTRNLKGVQCGVEHSIKASDHKPVWLDIDLSPNTAS